MTISELKRLRPSAFSGVFRIRRPFRCMSGNGSAYLACLLEDMSGTMKAFAWPERYRGPMAFSDLERVAVTGKLCVLRHGTVIHLHTIEIVQAEQSSLTALIPRSLCPLPHLLDKLQATVAAIGNPALRNFASNVLADDSIAFPLVSLPASRSHHHCHAGGLLEHSLACASMVGRYREFSQPVLDLGIVGALFHDVGKIKTVRAGGHQDAAWYVLNHDDLTLEVLAPHLKRLETSCRDAATALRYIWTWRRSSNRSRIPLMTVAEAVALADRVSAGLDAEKQAFHDRPDWQRFARFGRSALHWRPNLAQTEADNMDCITPFRQKQFVGGQP